METKTKRRPTSTGGRKPTKAPVRKKKSQVEVVYTPPKPFNRNRFLLRLATVAAVVLALLFGLSIFFKVETVLVSGAQKYTPWQVREASGIQEDDNLFGINAAQVGGRITTKLPYIAQARVGIRLPDTVCIEVVELDVCYAIANENGRWWLMDAEGKLIEEVSDAQAKGYTQIHGVKITGAQAGMAAVAAEPVPETVTQETVAEGESVPEITVPPVTIKASEQLSTAITILQYFEDNGIIGDAASLDVSNLGDIFFWYGERYQVMLGDSTQLGYKIESVKKAIDQSSEYQSGILVASFTIWPEKVGYTPF